jgi:molybdopterin-containing oxidoreductase family iron-sulfur binding subunit
VVFRTPVRHDPAFGVSALQALVTEIASGAVETLVITARNPVYGAPVDFKLDKLLERVPETIYYSLYEDETSEVATTFVPAAHTLESWGDTRSVDGTVSIIQPLIAPLWSPTTEADVLAAFVGEGDKGTHQLLLDLWQKRAVSEGWSTAAAFEGVWESWLSKGIIEKTAQPAEDNVSLDGGLAARWGRPCPSCPARAGWSWPSPSITRSSTAASATTRGCRSCPTRSPRSPGTTPC